MASVDEINTQIKRGNYAQALKAAQSDARRKPKDPYALDALARAFIAAGRQKNALATYDRLIKLMPGHVKPLADKAHLEQQMGLLEPSNRNLRKSLKIEPENGSLLRMLATTVRLTPDDPAVKRSMEMWKAGDLSPNDRMHAGYALFKALGPDGFSYLSEANDIQAKKHPWSIEERTKRYDDLIEALDKKPWPKALKYETNRRPIFVSGLPRSGTTLIEQILSCHPTVEPYGETMLPIRAAYSVMIRDEKFRPMSSLSPDEFTLIGQRYLQGISHFHGKEPIFTDKSVLSFLVAGILRDVLPDSRMIFVRRDPRDVGWSIYRNYFEGKAHGYSARLADIGAFAKLTYRIIDKWMAERPEAFLQVSYETLVNDPEPEIRRVLDYCGLEWDPACLSPEKNTRQVKTLSVEQVRSPISPKSIGGWRKYERELEPMIEAMGDWVKQWDCAMYGNALMTPALRLAARRGP